MEMQPAGRLSAILIRQIDPPLAMISAAIELCPEDVWAKSEGQAPVWQHVLHALYYLQKWMRAGGEPFLPPTFAAEEAVGLTAPAEPALRRETLRAYFTELFDHCHAVLDADDAELLREDALEDGRYSLMDRCIGQCKHLAYHAGCISTLLVRYTGRPLPYSGYSGKPD